MAVHQSVVAAVGATPLIRLGRLAEGLQPAIYVKAEYLNPGGSVKDRAARFMIEAAEASGALARGGTIVEGTSGNTGVGLAQAAASRGYRIIVVVPDKTAVEKIDLLRAYGAEVVITPSGLPREHPEHVARLAERLAAEVPGGWLANQYDNPANPAAHRATTGPEIWSDTGGTVTHFVAGIGTGGTITGTGEYLKQVSGGAVTVIGADPVTSLYNGGDGSPFFIEAAGHYLHPETVEDQWPQSYHPQVVDRIVAVRDREAITVTRRLARLEGLLVGGSAGLAAAAGLRVAAELGPQHTVVILLPDSGRSYLSKYHSPQWLRRLGFLDDDRADLIRDLVGPEPVVTIPSTASVAAAARIALTAPQSQTLLPVVLHRPAAGLPTAVSEILGAVDCQRLATLPPGGGADIGITEIAGPPPLSIGTGETVDEAMDRLDSAGVDRAVVLLDGRLAGLITRQQLADHRTSPDRRPAASGPPADATPPMGVTGTGWGAVVSKADGR